MAIGGAIIGLIANLVPWRKGVRDADRVVKESLNERTLEPFNRGVDKAESKMKGLGKGGLRNPFGAISGALAGLGMFGIFNEVREVVSKSVRAFDEYEDALVKVRFAADAIPDAMKRGFNVGRVKALARDIRNALGIGETQSVGVFADFLTRGFNAEQAMRNLTLAANAAVATGKPIEATADIISNAFNGNLRGLKELGISISETGNKIRDIESAGAAVTAKFGKIGVELVDPVDQLNANMEHLYVVLGERIAPILNPIVERVADFIGGLGETEEGRRALEGVGNALLRIMEVLPRVVGGFRILLGWLRASFGAVEFLYASLGGGLDWLWKKFSGSADLINGLILRMVSEIGSVITDFLNDSTAGNVLKKLLGIDKITLPNFQLGVEKGNEMMKRGAEQFDREESIGTKAFRETGLAEFKRGIAGVMEGWKGATGDGGDLADFFTRTADANKAAREQAMRSVTSQVDRAQGVPFAGAPAIAEVKQKEAEAAKKAKEKSAADHEKELARQASARDAWGAWGNTNGRPIVFLNARGSSGVMRGAANI